MLATPEAEVLLPMLPLALTRNGPTTIVAVT